MQCVRRWNESPLVRATLSSGPVEAWSGQLAFAVADFSPPEWIYQTTAANLHSVAADRQLEWSWWCTQIERDSHWQKLTAHIADDLLAHTMAYYAHRSRHEAYRLTHLIFYGTDFGRVVLTQDQAELAGLRRELCGILRTHPENHDLTAEILIALKCLGLQETQEADLALRRLSQAQLPNGAFVDANDVGAYHTCLVLLLPVSNPDSHGSRCTTDH